MLEGSKARAEWVGQWGWYLCAGGYGEREKVWIHGILDILTWPVEGVRMDWSPRTHWGSSNAGEKEKERVMGCWRFGEKEGSKENINDLTEARMDFSSVSSEPNFTAAQTVDWIGEKKRLLILPREINTYAKKASLTLNFVCRLIVQ